MQIPLTRNTINQYAISPARILPQGEVSFSSLQEIQEFVAQINHSARAENQLTESLSVGKLSSMAVLHQILQHVFELYLTEHPLTVQELIQTSTNVLERAKAQELFALFVEKYPPLRIFQGLDSPKDFLKDTVGGRANLQTAIINFILLWVSTKNPALSPFGGLLWDAELLSHPDFTVAISDFQKTFTNLPSFGPQNASLIEMLLSPAIAVPHSLPGQLDYIRDHWGYLLGDLLTLLLHSLDLIKEEQKPVFFPSDARMGPEFHAEDFAKVLRDEANMKAFSEDREWMPRLVLIAKNVYVWLDQLSKKYATPIRHLDQIPVAELIELRNKGITGLWLIGLWQRSPASAKIKQMTGNQEAIASAYSLFAYRIADDLGGDKALERLKETAARFGIRLASDMVPNHMGIDSEWVIHHPEWFLALDESPYPAYSFTGPDLSADKDISIQIEDHYYDHSDAAVVFKRLDKQSNQTKYIYHGNDGTAMPWNDTAQLNYLDPQVREEVIQTILNVARRFPIIRFDAAMTLAKKHIQRLWYPEPGEGGAIPSRSRFSLSKTEFDQKIPREFWREVVERIEKEVPDTLLLAEAFWLMEGYFVRTLGMHRVYNSAFMHMLRNENNAGYRDLIKKTIDFDPEILKRFVNFMNNPDEKTAIEQFGNGDKYFAVCTLMTTLPGLPMFGHGQIEGFTEKYGMEYHKALLDETADEAFIRRHEIEIFPLLYQRELFAGVHHFRLFDFMTSNGEINENVYAFSNALNGARTLVVVNNSYNETDGKIFFPFHSQNCNARNERINDLLGAGDDKSGFLRFRDLTSGLVFLRKLRELHEIGFSIHLNGYEHHVFTDFAIVHSDHEHDYEAFYTSIGQQGVYDLEAAIVEMRMKPFFEPLQTILECGLMDHPPVAMPIIKEYLHQLLQGAQHLLRQDIPVTALQAGLLRSVQVLKELHHRTDTFAASGMNKVAATFEKLNNQFVEDKTRKTCLIACLLLAGLIENHPDWLSSLPFTTPLATSLRHQGVPEDDIQSAVSMTKIALLQRKWFEHNPKQTNRQILASWFTDPQICQVLGVNQFDNQTWYHHESFQRFLWWMEILPILREMTKAHTSLGSIAEKVIELEEIFFVIHQKDAQSQCQVERLLS